jgi:hypothetical protein
MSVLNYFPKELEEGMEIPEDFVKSQKLTVEVIDKTTGEYRLQEIPYGKEATSKLVSICSRIVKKFGILEINQANPITLK